MDFEYKREQLQTALDKAKTSKERNILGQFSTPYPLACSIVNYIKNNLKLPSAIKFLEPSAGTGVFFSALKDRMPLTEALGFEIDSHYSVPSKKLWENQLFNIKTADFLFESPEPRFNLIVANPPYSRHHHIDIAKKKELAQLVKNDFGYTMSGLSGLYCYFVILSTLWLEEDGISVWLIPSEFMDVNYGCVLRNFLTTDVDLISIHKFNINDVQFSDALVSSCVVIFRNKKPTQAKVSLSSGSNLNSPSRNIIISKSILHSSDKWSHLFSDQTNITMENKVPLKTYFDVSRGISTGNNAFFILEKNFVDKTSFPKQFLNHILPSPRKLKCDIVRKEDVEKVCQYLFSCSMPFSILERQYPLVADYIRNAESANINKSYSCSRRSPWYSTEKREVAPFYLTYMGRGENYDRMFRFILNESDAIVTNSYLILYPKEQYKKDLECHTTKEKVWQVLQSIPKESIIRCGRSYGGGLYKIEPKELLNVLIPSLDYLFQYTPKGLFD